MTHGDLQAWVAILGGLSLGWHAINVWGRYVAARALLQSKRDER